MSQVLPSGKTGANKYDLRSNDPNKVLPRLDVRQIAQNNQRAYQQTQGYSLSGNEGAASAIDGSLSIIDDTTIGNYDDSMAKMIQTYVANASRLIVDGGSTANSLILNPPVISPGNSPNGTDYSEATSLPFAYKEGLRFTFLATLSNTGAVQVQIPGLSGLVGSVDLVDQDGNNLIQGDIVVNNYYTIIAKNISGDKFILERPNFNIENIKSQLPVGKNLIINGDFEIAQRGTSFTSVANNSYTLDRYVYGKSGAMVHTISQDSDVPTVAQAGRYIPNSMLIDCTTVDTSIAAGDYCFVTQYLEGYNFQAIAQKTFTISFWVKATKTGTYCVAFVNSGYNRGYIAEYTVNSSDTWEKKIITVTASPSAGTWNYINGVGLRVEFALACGTTRHTTAGTWNTGDFLATSNQVNACDNTANNFRLAGVQVEAGSVATEFEKRSIQQEINLCQRYFKKSLLPNQITISNGTDTDHDIDFTAGNFQFDDGTGQAVATALTKQIDAAWVAGDAAGGLDTGTVAADTTYYCFAIYNPATQTSDFLFSTSSSSPTLPSGYTKKKRIASLLTDGAGNIRNGEYIFNRDGSYNFIYNTSVLAIGGSGNFPLTLTNLSIATPSGIKTSPSFDCLIRSTGSDGIAIADFDTQTEFRIASCANSQNTGSLASGALFTNLNSQVKYRNSGTDAFVDFNFDINVCGWFDNNL